MVHTFEVTGAQDAADKGTQRVTAANASGINDGAAAIILASGEAVEKYGLKPMAKLIGWGQGGVDPKIMGVGPVPASRQALKKAGLTIDDIDLVEANEAFAAQSIAVARELHFDMSKVNVNGGAIALGHPVGASGARIIVTLLHEMQKRPEAKKGLATLCIGGGISREGERLLAPIRKEVEDTTYGRYSTKQPKIVAAQLGNDAGIIGAAFLGLSK